jgi:hypothetical protein
MTAVKTLQKPITTPNKEYSLDDFVSQNFIPPNLIEDEEPETRLEWFDRWCRESDERRARGEAPPYDDPPLSMEEIVAMCKEVRAEMYAEEQERKNASHR